MGTGFADCANHWFHSLRDEIAIHVGQAIEDLDGWVQLGQQLTEFRLHSAVARKAEIDDLSVRPSSENRRVHHTGGCETGFVISDPAEIGRWRIMALTEIDYQRANTVSHPGALVARGNKHSLRPGKSTARRDVICRRPGCSPSQSVSLTKGNLRNSLPADHPRRSSLSAMARPAR